MASKRAVFSFTRSSNHERINTHRQASTRDGSNGRHTLCETTDRIKQTLSCNHNTGLSEIIMRHIANITLQQDCRCDRDSSSEPRAVCLRWTSAFLSWRPSLWIQTNKNIMEPPSQLALALGAIVAAQLFQHHIMFRQLLLSSTVTWNKHYPGPRMRHTWAEISLMPSLGRISGDRAGCRSN